MTDIVNATDREAVVAAVEENLFEMVKVLGRSPLGEAYEGPDLIRYVTGIPAPVFNGVVRARLSADEANGRIREVLAYFRIHGLPMMWWLGPSTRPSDLGPRLLAHGLTLAEVAPGMAADLEVVRGDVATPINVRIERVRDLTRLHDYVRAAGTGFGMSEPVIQGYWELEKSFGLREKEAWRRYVAYLDDRAVGSAGLFLAAGVAGIYNVSTASEARCRGIGAAMTQVAMSDARKEAYRVSVLESSRVGFKVYRRLGFEQVCEIPQYIWTP